MDVLVKGEARAPFEFLLTALRRHRNMICTVFELLESDLSSASSRKTPRDSPLALWDYE